MYQRSATPLGNPALSLSSTAPGATATYTASFVATHALSAGTGTVTLAAAPGTAFPAAAQNYSIVDASNPVGSGTVTATPALSDSGATVTLVVPNAISAGDSISVVASAVTNPADPVAASLAMLTSADARPVLRPYRIGAASMSASTVSASPTTTPEIGGPYGCVSYDFLGWPCFASYTTITLQLLSSTGKPVAGHVIELSPSASVLVQPTEMTTTPAGTATFLVGSPSAQTVNFSASDLSQGGATLSSMASVTFTSS
jgi:hypothetical protein